MSHIARVEVPGAFHLVEQRLRSGQPPLSRFPERILSLLMLHHCLRERGVQLCGYNFLPRRTLLVLIPAQAGAIGRAIFDADLMFAGLAKLIRHRFTPLWEGTYKCCPFSDDVIWSVLRYVDMASVRAYDTWPFARRALSSAAEHTGQTGGYLTVLIDRLPPVEQWRAWLESPQDREFVLALEQCLRTGKPFGPFSFVRKVEQACGRRLRPASLSHPELFA